MAETLSSEQRVRLIRKGNEFYNAGRIEDAKHIFVRTKYIDGMIRVADHYYDQQKPAAALLMYRAAGCKEKVEELYERIVAVIRLLLEEDRLAELGSESAEELPDEGV